MPLSEDGCTPHMIIRDAAYYKAVSVPPTTSKVDLIRSDTDMFYVQSHLDGSVDLKDRLTQIQTDRDRCFHGSSPPVHQP
jgi:hypothetical protein